MSEHDNVQLVKEGYADFLSGNIPGVLDRFADDFEFTVPGAPEVPYAGTKRTRDELAGFFQGLDQTVMMTLFEPREYLAAGDRVVALGRYEGHVKQSGGTFATDWAMIWTIRDGKVRSFREISDPTALRAGFVG
jgi:ketosteroid isomerase-like protein